MSTVEASTGLVGVIVLVSVLLFGLGVVNVAWSVWGLGDPTRVDRARFRYPPTGRGPRISLLVPATHERAVLGDTLDLLATQAYHEVEIVVVVGDDDPDTDDVARAAAARHPGVITVVVDPSAVGNRARALNRGLRHCTGDVIGVVDAEDEVHPHLLALVAAHMEATNVDGVQAGVQLANHADSWWAVRTVVGHAVWFGSKLPFSASQSVVPLAGHSFFVRRRALESVRGWDERNLAADYDLGLRLSAAGIRVAVVSDPRIATREETPPDLREFFRLRVTWQRGLLRCLHTGAFLAYPTLRAKAWCLVVLLASLVPAPTVLVLALALACTASTRLPVLVSLSSWGPAVPLLVLLVVECTVLVAAGKAVDRRVRALDLVRLVVGVVPYALLVAAAAVVAVVRETQGTWGTRGSRRTHHRPQTTPVGTHRRPSSSSSEAPRRVDAG